MVFICDQTGADSWTCYQPDGRVDTSKVLSGIGDVPTHSCQFWVKGMPTVCGFWDSGSRRCTYEGEPLPTGYNLGACDGLGRKPWCDKYNGEGAEPGYICVAPSIERTGLGTQIDNPDIDYVYLISIPPSDISGYNDQDGVGKCDGRGMGRGPDAFEKSVEELKKLPVFCNYYRPFAMGFGALQPQEFIKNNAGDIFIEDMYAGATEERERRLPYGFKAYNLRARVQKCAHWDQDFGTNFTLNEISQIILTGEPFDGSKVSYCKCPDSASDPYRTRVLDSDKVRPILKRVWSEQANTVICNGAKPECPCYTGEWLYVLDEKMLPGMRIEAEQILELRFWIHNWPDQETYDRYFQEIPNKHADDPTDSAIYTFSYWDSLSQTDPGESIMKGKKLNLCFPINPAERTFDKSKYLKVEEVTYPTAYFKRGTTAPKQVSYPTLVRDLDTYQPIPLEITYPYPEKDPFNSNAGCGVLNFRPTPCIKRSNRISSDNVSVIGSTVRNKGITVINMSYVGDSFSGFDQYESSFFVPENQRTKFLNEILKFIERVEASEHSAKGMSEATADSNGVFVAGPIELKVGMLNKLVVIVYISDTSIEYRVVEVFSIWQGGVVNQTEFNKIYTEDSGYIDSNDTFLTPNGTIKAEAYPLVSANGYSVTTYVDGMVPFLKRENSTVTDTRYSLNYTIKKVKATASIDRWMRVGNAGHIWLEIDDLNLNYMFYWSFDKISVTIAADEIKKTESRTLEYRILLPNDSTKRINIPRNALLIRPKTDEVVWVTPGTTITIDYWYEKIFNDDNESSNEEIVYPDLEDPMYSFVSNSFSIKSEITSSLGKFEIEGVRSFTVGTLTKFVDEEGALVSAVATKFLVDISILKCRTVEAFYKWKVYTKRYQLEPHRGWVEEVKPSSFVAIEEKFRIPPCGDHEYSGTTHTGPMWYPFDSCFNREFYDVATTTNFCTLPHEGIPRNDYRACGPDKNFVYVPGDAGISACVLKFLYQYATSTIDPVFCGWANLVPWVNPIFYNAMGWALPTFGNTSREYVERFISQDYVTYQSKETGELKMASAWLPMVPDVDSFEMTFNSLDIDGSGGVYTKGSDPIYINQMNFLLAGYLEEKVKGDRYRFEEVFDTRIERRVSYPPPLLEDERGPYYTMFNFLDEGTVWVWRELWKDIDRKQNGSEFIKFVSLDTPEYVFDIYKKEHKLVADEGLNFLVFKPPIVDDDGNLKEYPSLSLGSGPERYFEIIYDDYDSDTVEWKDENHGEVDGSGVPNQFSAVEESPLFGGEGEDIGQQAEESATEGAEELPYELSKDPDVWLQDPNILLTPDYAINEGVAEEMGREIYLSYDYISKEYDIKYYNQGIIANIPKNRLRYMPVLHKPLVLGNPTSDVEIKKNPKGDSDNSNTWLLEPECTITYELGEKCCPSRIRIIGEMGVDSYTLLLNTSSDTTKTVFYELNKPGITINTEFGEITSFVAELAPTSTVKSKITELYTMNIDFEIHPKAMTTERTDWLSITFTNSAGCFSKILSIAVDKAEYKKAKETIYIWERRYIKSTGSNFGDSNPNGPDKLIAPKFGFAYGGLYFPEWIMKDEKVSVNDKLRGYYADLYHYDSEDLDWGNGLDKEVELQQEIYESAEILDELGDVRSYIGFVPPVLESYMSSANVQYSPPGAVITSEKLSWSRHYVQLGYEPIETPWQPEGHIFSWSPNVTYERCLEFGPKHAIYEPQFVHKHLPGFIEQPATPFDAYIGSVRNAYTQGKTIGESVFKSKGYSAWGGDEPVGN
jgi:hypothetical protein